MFGFKNVFVFVFFQCSSKILPPGKGAYQDSEPFDLHVMHKKLEEEGVEKEKIKQVCCLTFRKLSLYCNWNLLSSQAWDVQKQGWHNDSALKCSLE